MRVGKRKNTLAPITEENAAENRSPQIEIETDVITEDSTMDSYLSKSEKPNVDYSEKDAEIEVLNEKIESLEKEKKEAFDDNRILLEKIEQMKKKQENVETKKLLDEISSLKERMEVLENRKDSLLLQNSELEFEVTRLTTTLKNIQSKKDDRLHTYTNSGYSGNGGYVPAKNGYQDWT
jgi:chromosome segregation ATPase